jgi:hypothetical protein
MELGTTRAERHGVDPPPDYGLEPPAPAEASPRAGPQVACEAPAGQESAAASDVDRPPVIPVADQADVTYPSDDLGAVVFGDPVGIAQAAGGAAILTGIALSSLRLLRTRRPRGRPALQQQLHAGPERHADSQDLQIAA